MSEFGNRCGRGKIRSEATFSNLTRDVSDTMDGALAMARGRGRWRNGRWRALQNHAVREKSKRKHAGGTRARNGPRLLHKHANEMKRGGMGRFASINEARRGRIYSRGYGRTSKLRAEIVS